MSDDATGDAVKRERSPSFPFIGLSKAVERTRQLYEKAKRFEVLLSDAAQAWGLQPKSSSTLQTAAALIAYGLIEDSGSGVSRKVKVSDSGARIIGDTRPGVQEQLLAEAALKPKLIAEYAQKWAKGRPDDHFCVSELKFEKGFNEDAASRFLRVFDETIKFTAVALGERADDKNGTGDERPNLAIGDSVQWTSGGVDQFVEPKKIVSFSEDGEWLWVEGSATGIPSSEAQVVPVGKGQDRVSPMPTTPLGSAPRQGPQPSEFEKTIRREERFALTEGDVVISFPEQLSLESVEDLEAYIEIFLKKARRRAISER